MELGNMAFGNSRGKFSVPREEWQEYFYENLVELLENQGLLKIRGAMGEDGFENGTFWLEPYHWGGCTCGWEAKLNKARKEWKQDNPWHRDDCYQTKLRERKLEAGLTVYGDHDRGEPMYLQKSKHSYDKSNELERQIYRELTAEFDLPMKGCAVHCTCDYNNRLDQFYEDFVEEHGEHPETCKAVKPNFHFKPTRFKLQWYKYPLRDSYMNKDIDFDRFCEIVDQCRESVL